MALFYATSRRTFRLRPLAEALGCFGTRAGSGVAGLLFAVGTVQAQLPTGANVVAGQAAVTQTATQQVIQQVSDKVILDWNSFSVGAGNSVRFIQPSSSSIALNRVVGGDASTILGNISSNGQIFLVNPNGIFFGAGAVLDTGGLVASTLNIRNEDFLAGRYVFARDATSVDGSSVSNAGLLRAANGGYILLAGERVSNLAGGALEAKQGTVAMAAGGQFTVDIQGDRLLNFTVDVATADRLGGVTNLGLIAADGGRVVLSARAAREAAGAAINNGGVIRAGGIAEQDGEIILTATDGEIQLSGSLDVSGVHGGRIQLSGERIALLSGASLNASGQQGGGTILVGGDKQGAQATVAGAAVANAQAVYIDQNTTLKADAGQSGDGGKIVVWSDNITRAYGRFSARGGSNSGNGGFVETSAKSFLDVAGIRVDTSALLGARGQWLLDPTDITIAHGVVGTASFNGAGLYDVGTNPTSILTDGDINANLSATNVTISTTSAAAGTGNITVNGSADTGGAVAISSTGNKSLSLVADGAIAFNGGSQVDLGSGNLLLSAGNGVSQGAGSVLKAAGLSLQGTGNFVLGQASDIRNNVFSTVAANVTGDLSVTSVNSGAGSFLSIGTVNGISGIQSHGGNIAVYSDSTAGLQVNAAVTTGSATVGTVDLIASEATTTGNQPLALNAAVTGGTVRLTAADSLSQTSAGVISANNLVVRYAAGSNADSVDLSQADNQVQHLAATVTGSATAAGNSFSFRNGVGTALQVGTVDGVAGINSSGGDISLRADSLDLAQTLNASAIAGANVLLSTSASNRAINLGTESATALSLTVSELAMIKTGANGLLRIGTTTQTGGIDLSSSIAAAPNTWSTLSLKTGGTVTQSGGVLSVANLAVEALGAGPVSLTNTSTSAGTVAIRGNGAVTYNYGSGTLANLTVTSLDGVTGISSQGGNISLSSSQRLNLLQDVNAGAGTIALAAVGNGVAQTGGVLTASGLKLSGSGSFSLDQTGNQVGTVAASINGALSLTESGLLQVGSVGGINGISTSGGAVTLTADRLAVNQNIATSNGSITLKPLTAGTAIDLGSSSDATANTLEISAAEIGRLISGTGTQTFGGTGNNGQIKVSSALTFSSPVSLVNGTGGIQLGNSLSSSGAVTLTSGGTVADVGGTSGISASSLSVDAVGGLSFSGSNNAVAALYLANSGGGNIQFNDHATVLAINSVSQAGGGNISITNTGTLALSAAPISTGGGDLSLVSGGAMTLLQDINAGAGTVDLRVGSGGLTQSGGVITANSLRVSGTGNFLLNNVKSATAAGTTTYSYNNVATLAADVTGSLNYRDEDALLIGTVSGLTGINTHGNSLSLTSGGTKTQTGATTTTVGGTLNLNSSLQGGLISLTANNAGIAQNAGTLTATTLVAVSDGAVSFTQTGNHAGNVSLMAGGQVDYQDAGAFTVSGSGVSSGSSNANVNLTSTGAMTLTQGVNAGTGRVSLVSGAGITQSGGGITARDLLLQGTGDFVLTNGSSGVSSPSGSNNVDTLAASVAGNISYVDSNGLTIGTVNGVSGVNSTTGGTVSLRTVDGSLTVNQAVTSGTSGSRGNVAVVAGGESSILTLNHDVRGAEVRINSEGTLVQNAAGCGAPPCSGTPSFVEATSLLLGAQNDPLTAVFNRSAVTLSELVRYFKGDTTLNENLSANKLIIYGLDGATSFKLGSGYTITASSLMLGGSGSFYLDNVGNNVSSLVVFRPWGNSNSYKVSYTDSDAFAIGSDTWNAKLTHKEGSVNWTWTEGSKSFVGINNNGNLPSYGFTGSGGDIKLVATGSGNSIVLSNSIINSGGMVSLTSPAGLSEATGAIINASKLKVIANGSVLLGNDNKVSQFAAQVSQANQLTLKNVDDLIVGTVDGLAGVTLTGPGESTLDIYSGKNLSVTSDVSVVTASGADPNAAPAHLKLRADRHIDISANVTARGGSATSTVGSEILLESTRGHVSQTAGTISAYDDGAANIGTPMPAPHSAKVTVRAGADALDNGYSINQCNANYSGCGSITLGNILAQSSRGSAIIDVFAPLGLNATGNLTARGQTAPRISLTGDVQNSSGNLVSSGDITISGSVTVDQPGGVDVNTKASGTTAGLLISGKNITTNSNGYLTTTSKYGISISAQNNITIGANLSTTANDGISLSTTAAAGVVKTINGARVTAKQLGLTGDRDVGVFNLTTDIGSLQVLGARALTIDNSVHTGMLLATVIGRISAATTDPTTGQVIPAVDKPVGAISITTGGDLTTFSLNNNSSSVWDLNGNLLGAGSKRVLTLVTDKIVETPGAFSLSADSIITLRPYTANRPIVVKKQPGGTTDPGTTYYYGGTSGLLNQFNPSATLIIGGSGYQGNITIGSQSGGNWLSSEQFSLGDMSVTFSTSGRVYNLYSADPNSPVNWVGGSTPYTPYPTVVCNYGQACIAKISTKEVIIIDSLKQNGVNRNIRIAGQGDGSGGYTPPSGAVGGNNGSNNGGGNSNAGSGGSSSSGSSGPSNDSPGGGGNQGSPGGVATTIVVVTTPSPSAGTVTAGNDGGSSGASPSTPAAPVALAPDGGSSSGGGSFSGVGSSSGGGASGFDGNSGSTSGSTGGSGFAGTDPGTGSGSGGLLNGGDSSGNDGSGLTGGAGTGSGGSSFAGSNGSGAGGAGSSGTGGTSGTGGADLSGDGNSTGGNGSGLGSGSGTGSGGSGLAGNGATGGSGADGNGGNGLIGDGSASGSNGSGLSNGAGSGSGGSGLSDTSGSNGSSAGNGGADGNNFAGSGSGSGSGSDGSGLAGSGASSGSSGSGFGGGSANDMAGSPGNNDADTGNGSGANGNGSNGNSLLGDSSASGSNGSGFGGGSGSGNGTNNGNGSGGANNAGTASSGNGNGAGSKQNSAGGDGDGLAGNGASSGATGSGLGGASGKDANGNGADDEGTANSTQGNSGSGMSSRNSSSDRDSGSAGEQGSALSFVGGGEGDASAADQARTSGAGSTAFSGKPRVDTPECAADRSQEVRTISSSPDGGRPLVAVKGPGARLSSSSCGAGPGGGNK